MVRRGARELRVAGSFSSYYEPGEVLTGSVWDAIAAGALALPARKRGRQQVLLLGLGGGSAARVVRALLPDARIVGVEIDPEVVRLARRWFDLDALGVEVVVDDALRYLARTRSRFDAIFEDCFVGTGDDAVKPEGFPRPALDRAASKLARGGILVSNSLDEWREVRDAVARLRPSVVRIDIDGYDNRIYVGGPARLTARGLRAAVAGSSVLRPTLPNLRFRGV